MSLGNEDVFDVFWEGPKTLDELSSNGVHENFVIYMICGTHGLYGRNVPLYIGKTDRGIAQRISEHHWLEYEPDPVSVYVAAIGAFTDWATTEKTEEYPPPDIDTIKAVEQLLIYAHQPVYNQRSKLSINDKAAKIRIFNTGRRATLFPELSGLYWAEL